MVVVDCFDVVLVVVVGEYGCDFWNVCCVVECCCSVWCGCIGIVYVIDYFECWVCVFYVVVDVWFDLCVCGCVC